MPLTGWAIHAVALHKQLTVTRRDPLTGLLRRDSYITRARRLVACHDDTVTVVMVDADHFDVGHDLAELAIPGVGVHLNVPTYVRANVASS